MNLEHIRLCFIRYAQPPSEIARQVKIEVEDFLDTKGFSGFASPEKVVKTRGEKLVKETSRYLDKSYEINFEVSDLGEDQNIVLFYLLCLMDDTCPVHPDIPYSVTFKFERSCDREFFINKTSELMWLLHGRDIPIKSIRAGLL